MAIAFKAEQPQIEQIKTQLGIPADMNLEMVYQEGVPLRLEKNGNVNQITYGRRVELFRGFRKLPDAMNRKCRIMSGFFLNRYLKQHSSFHLFPAGPKYPGCS